EITVGDVDEPHHPEDQSKPGGEHGVKPTDQHTLDDDVDPFHRGCIFDWFNEAPQTGCAPPPCLQRNSGLAGFGHYYCSLSAGSAILPLQIASKGVACRPSRVCR